MKKIFIIAAWLILLACGVSSSNAQTSVKVLQFNVWMETSVVPDGFDALVDAIIQSDADIVSLNEVEDHADMSFTQKLVQALKKKGVNYNTFRSETSGIISKYPIRETAVFFPKKKINKAIIQTPGGDIAVYSVHLDHTHYSCYYPRGYDGNSWEKMAGAITDPKIILEDTLASDRPEAIALVIRDAKKEMGRGLGVVIAGDFNEPSRRDWVEATKDLYGHNGVVVSWPTTRALEENGFTDAYREKFPDPVSHPGFTYPANNPAVDVAKLTWAPEADERERIDFIFYSSGEALKLQDVALFGPKGCIINGKREALNTSDRIVEPGKTWPSDHNAVLATFVMPARVQNDTSGANAGAGRLLTPVIHFDTKWRFIIDDKPEYKNENFNDSDWRLVAVPSSDRGREGFGWYRVRFAVPQEMIGKEMVLFAGTIDAVDETFINGTLVGKSGRFPSQTEGVQSFWDQERMYRVPAGVVKGVNTLAIRMYCEPGIGGIYKGRLALMTRETYERERAARAEKKQSYFQLTSSNGLIAAVYNAETDRVEVVSPHLFSTVDEGQFVDPVAYAVAPVTEERPVAVEYAENTHVIRVQYKDFEVFYFASFVSGDKVFYAVARGAEPVVKNISFRYDEGKGRVQTGECVITKDGRAEKYFLLGFTDARHPDASVCAKAKERLVRKNTSLLSEELQFMRSLIARCRIPGAASADEKRMLEQCVAFLKMSQVADNEIFPFSHGQVLASLPPGPWNTTWVRDGSFAISAMARLGMLDEARRGLEFMLRAQPSGRYVHYIFRDGKDYGIGVDYQISATRYFGNGKEECDSNEDGPNIEIDDFGLFLIALDDYVRCSGDVAFYKQWESVLSKKVADAIIHNIDANGMIRRDSGPWEHHLPGRQYTFTSGVCAEGLKRFAAWQKNLGFAWEKYAAASDTLLGGIMKNAVYENRLIKGDAEDQSPSAHYFYDAGTFELFASGLIADKGLFESHMLAYDKVMKVKGDCGYIRVFSDDTYENQEWPFADLRVAVAHVRFGNRSAAKPLIDKVTALSSANFGAVPEIYRLGDCYFRGSIPMVGYGAGAYVLAVLDYYGE